MYSQIYISKMVGVPQTTICRLFRGELGYRKSTWELIAGFLGEDWLDLVRLEPSEIERMIREKIGDAEWLDENPPRYESKAAESEAAG